MSYGIASNETRAVLGAEIEHITFEEGPYRLDIVIEGALNESFDFDALDYDRVIDVMGDHLQRTLGLLEWTVSVYDSEGEPPELRGERYSSARED